MDVLDENSVPALIARVADAVVMLNKGDKCGGEEEILKSEANDKEWTNPKERIKLLEKQSARTKQELKDELKLDLKMN